MKESSPDATKKDKDYIRSLQKYAETTQKHMDYALERFDILIISLSSSGMVLSIGFVKDIIPDFSQVNPILLKTTWLLFALSLIMNLFSQVSGYYANQMDLRVTNDIIRTKQGKGSRLNQQKMDKRMKNFNFTTVLLNAGSLFGLVGGIVTLIVFISKYV